MMESLTVSAIVSDAKRDIVDGPFGSNLKLSDYVDDLGEGVPVLTTKNLEGNYSPKEVRYISKEKYQELKRSSVLPGDILVAKIGSVGKTGRYPDDAPIAVIPANLLKVTVDKSKADRDYAYHYFNSPAFQEAIRSICTATAQPAFNVTKFRDLPFPLAPLPEQRRIVSAIETQLGRLDAAVARLHAAKAKLKRYKQAVLKAAVEGAIENGDMVPLEELIASIGQGWSPKCLNTPSPDEETWGVIKTTAIQPGAYVAEENKELPKPLMPRPEHELKAGDVLVTRAGPRSRVGITCLVRETRPRLMNCDKAYRLRFDAKRIEPAYVEMLLNSPQITDQLDDLKTGISDSGVNLTQGRFLILEMPVIGLKEQRTVIRKTQEATASIAEMESTLDAQLLQSTRLRQAVLKRAFEGRLG